MPQIITKVALMMARIKIVLEHESKEESKKSGHFDDEELEEGALEV